MSKRHKTQLERLLRNRTRYDNKPIFIRDNISAAEFYEGIIAAVGSIEDHLYIQPDSPNKSMFEIVHQVFPLIESISYSLFDKSSRHYLKQLGYTDGEADVIIKIFRNGYAHSNRARMLKYDDGEVSWSILSGGGNTGPMPYDPGYTSKDYPEDNEPAEVVFDYVSLPNGSYHASLSIDRLLAQIRYDIEQRSNSSNSETVSVIVGEIVKGKRRKPSRALPKSGAWR